MCGVRLIGIGRLTLSMEKMARVDVGLDDAQPNLRAMVPAASFANLRDGAQASSLPIRTKIT